VHSKLSGSLGEAKLSSPPRELLLTVIVVWEGGIIWVVLSEEGRGDRTTGL